jgi:hypothetical protein
MTLLFCNTGWMEHFQGNTATDTIKGGGSYVIKNGMGHEVCNFVPSGQTLFGFVQSKGEGMNIARLGADKSTDQIDGITVVWTAKRPNGHTVVVGWYRNATVFRQYQRHTDAPPAQAENGIDTYLMAAIGGRPVRAVSEWSMRMAAVKREARRSDAQHVPY